MTHRHLSRILPVLVASAAALVLHADTTGRVAGKVTNKKGEPLPAAVLTLKRIDVTWTKVVPVNAKGAFLQVGLEPKEFDITVSCKGYVDNIKRVKVPLGEVATENFIMLTAEEQLVEARSSGKAPAEDAGVQAENEATEATNQAIAFYKERKFSEAQPLLETAQLKFNLSMQKTKDDKAKASLTDNLATSERLLGIVMAHNYAADPAKADLAAKAQPLLEKALARKADDQFCLQAIVDLAKAKKDVDLEKKYKPALDKLVGPKPENSYNDAVTAFNAGKAKEAKEFIMATIQIDPKFSESYYLLGMVEYGNMNLKACKESLLKYLELDPKGKKAAEVKEMLNDPSLKKIK